jgi:hypothetical protein
VGAARSGNHIRRAPDELGSERRQDIHSRFRPAIFDRDIAALDIAGLLQALAERGNEMCKRARELAMRNPITGIAGCWGCAASGSAIAAPAMALMKSRSIT